jgi:phosphate starvation-inducible PhoH-like protein
MTDVERPDPAGQSATSRAATPHAQPTHTVVIPDEIPMVTLLGPSDELLRTIERAFPRIDVHVRGNEFRLTGDSAELALAERLIDELLSIVGRGQPLNRDAVERSIGMLRTATSDRPADVLTLNIVSSRGRTIRPKTLNQKHYVDAIDAHTIVFGLGPAGTGKTYLAMAKAVAALQAKEVNRIILTRPAVEAGERLGFLPGTLTDKIDPYLRPLYDALHDMVDPESMAKLMAAGTIEVAPLAYMRGRAQPLTAKVMTPDGWRRIGSLRVGDLVTGSDGRPTPVLGVFPQGEREVYRVTMQDGSSTLACAEHLWQVRTQSDKRRGRHRVLQTQHMAGKLRTLHHRTFEIPVVAPVEQVELPVPMDAYEVGQLLAAGSSVPVAVHALATVGEPAAPEQDLSRPAEPAMATRSVPSAYLHNALRVRHALLQGLLDRAGTLRRAGLSTRLELRVHHPALRGDVIDLVRSLGGTAIAARDAYVIDIRLPEEIEPFRLERKRTAYRSAGAGRPMRMIDSIEHAGVAETVCIQVAAQDSLYVTDDYVVTHNTLNDAFIILDEAQNTSPEQMKMFLTRLGFGSKMVVTGDTTQVDLPGGVQSGLKVVQDILDGLDDIHFARLTSQDVVRHRLIGDIVDAYGRYDARQQRGPRRTRPAPEESTS